MQRLTAIFSLNTPAFIGCADNEKFADLRPTSLKGLLRWWYRAIKYADVLGDIEKLQQQESAIFGSTKAQSKIKLSVTKLEGFELIPEPEFHPKLGSLNHIRYLGYGVVEAFGKGKQGHLTNACIQPGRFKVEFVCRNGHGDLFDQEGDFVRTLTAFGMLGGIGAKSRKGFGSVTLEQIECTRTGGQTWSWTCPTDLTSLKSKLDGCLGKCLSYASSELPAITAFSNQTELLFLHSSNNALGLMDGYSERMQWYRSWGFKGIAAGRKSEKRFFDDHEWKYRRAPAGFHPKRVVFGLPHNYGQGDKLAVTAKEHDRRASPLFYHVHRFGENSFAGLMMVIQSQFLPAGEEINAGGKNVRAVINYDVLTKFPNTRQRDWDGKDWVEGEYYFPDRERLWG